MAKSVFVDLTPLVTKSTERGIGRYVRGLVSGLAEVGFGESAGLDVRGFSANRNVARFTYPELLAYSRVPAEPPVPYANYRRTWLVSVGLPLLHTPPDALIHLSEPMGIPWLERRRYTITCHDLISLALPELYLPKIPRWTALYAAVERIRYGKAERILAVSHATKRDLVRFASVPEEKIDVVWHGVDHDRFSPDPESGEQARVSAVVGTDAPYVLYLGAGDARKDLDTLVSAYLASRARRETHLVIAGNIGEERAARLRALAERARASERVHVIGYVDETLVPALYRASRAHVFPSRYEGFGLPVLEALACGTPTITSPGSSLDEVAGDAALVVPCGLVDPLAVAIDALVFEDECRTVLRERGLERASTFTWSRCAEETLAFWKRALS